MSQWKVSVKYVLHYSATSKMSWNVRLNKKKRVIESKSITDTIHMPADLDNRIASAVVYFWTTRTGQITRQTANGVRDQGNRGAVTGGKQLDGFVELIHNLLSINGVPEEFIFINSDLELPGCFRPKK